MSERDKDKSIPTVIASESKFPLTQESDLVPTHPNSQAIFDALLGKGTEDELDAIEMRIQSHIDSFPENLRKIPNVSESPKKKIAS